MRTYYDVLGIDPSAGADECQHAYRVRAQLLHPDRHADAAPEVITAAGAAMQELNEAWSVLGDSSARAAYDRSLNGAATTSATPQATHRPPSEGECRFCGSRPAVNARVRSETGKILRRTRQWMDGPFCRDCGVSTFRYMTNRTLISGWWGTISFFANWLTIFGNAGAWWRFRGLAAPQPTPGVVGILPRPAPTGASLWRRPGVYLAMGILVVFVIIGASSVSNSSSRGSNSPAGTTPAPASLVGSCIDLNSSGSFQSVVSCGGTHDAMITEVVSYASQCPYGTTDYFTSRTDGTGLCVNRSR